MAQFSTHANSGMMPGAAVTMGAGAAAGGLGAAGTALSVGAGGLKAYRSEVDTLAAMSADQAAAYLSQLFAREGWIAAQ